MRIALLGDSTTEVNYLPTEITWASLLAERTGAVVDNWGDSGKTTLDFLFGGSNRDWVDVGPIADVYIISFGYNDEDDYDSATFKAYTAQLVAEIEALNAIPILLTQPTVDYPDHAFTNPNPTIEEFNGRYLELGVENETRVCDYGQHITDQIASGNWDWRIRRYSLLSPPDNVITNPDVWDDTLDATMEPIHGSLWFENIHGNPDEQTERTSFIGDYMADISWSDVLDFAPGLSAVATNARTVILAWVNDEALNADQFGGDTASEYKLARIYLAAHFGQLSSNLVNNTGAVQSEQIGDLRRSFQMHTTNNPELLASTRWGQMYLSLVRRSYARLPRVV